MDELQRTELQNELGIIVHQCWIIGQHLSSTYTTREQIVKELDILRERIEMIQRFTESIPEEE